MLMFLHVLCDRRGEMTRLRRYPIVHLLPIPITRGIYHTILYTACGYIAIDSIEILVSYYPGSKYSGLHVSRDTSYQYVYMHRQIAYILTCTRTCIALYQYEFEYGRNIAGHY